MRIAVTPLDSEQLTAVEIDLGDGAPWVFLPFEDRKAQIDPLGERHILARGQQYGVAIFDCVARRRTNLSLDVSLKNHIWTYAKDRASIFVVESVDGKGYGNLRELSLDGVVNRSWPIAEGFHASHVHARDDGAIVCVNEEFGEVAVLDPSTATSKVNVIDGFKTDCKHSICKLAWYSPNGRWALRGHLGSVIRERVDEPSVLLKHPDLTAMGEVYYGVGLDLVDLDSARLEKTLFIRYLANDALFPGLRLAQQEPLDEFQRMVLATIRERQSAIEALAERHPYRRWNGQDQLFMAKFPEGEIYDCEREKVDEWVYGTLFLSIRNISWAPDSRSFTVVFEDLKGREERLISLEGEVGPLQVSAWNPPFSRHPWGTEALTKALRKDLRTRSVQRIPMVDLSPASLHAAVRELADRMEAGLHAITFRDTLQVEFKIARQKVSERVFFTAVDALTPEEFSPILPDLRRLLSSFSAQAARHVCTAHATIIGGGEPEEWKLALSDAALVLARRDPSSHDILADWIKWVDQEHDSFAAEKVFPAIVKTAGWATPKVTRFGLWFALHQWQTVSYDLGALGIIDAAQHHWTPEAFAELALDVAQEVVAETGPGSVGTDLGSCLGRIEEMLTPLNAWRERALTATARLFQVEPICAVYIN